MEKKAVFSALGRQTKGASLVEYGILASLIGVVAIAAVSRTGSEIDNVFSSTSDSLNSNLALALPESGGSAPPAPLPGVHWTYAIDTNENGFDSVSGTNEDDDHLTITYSDINIIAAHDSLTRLNFYARAGNNTIIMSGFNYTTTPADPSDCTTGQAYVVNYPDGASEDFRIHICDDAGASATTIPILGAIDSITFENQTIDPETIPE